MPFLTFYVQFAVCKCCNLASFEFPLTHFQIKAPPHLPNLTSSHGTRLHIKNHTLNIRSIPPGIQMIRRNPCPEFTLKLLRDVYLRQNGCFLWKKSKPSLTTKCLNLHILHKLLFCFYVKCVIFTHKGLG